MASKPMDECGACVVLGLSEGCSAADVRRAYRRLALLCHPDKNPEQNAEESERRFRDITSAKDCLLEKLGKGPTLGSLLSAAQRRRARWCKPGPVRVERVVPVKPQQPPRVVVWACHVCEVLVKIAYSHASSRMRTQSAFVAIHSQIIVMRERHLPMAGPAQLRLPEVYVCAAVFALQLWPWKPGAQPCWLLRVPSGLPVPDLP
ncbi:dnaJ [Symbiodinium pilosum]|uniref:DnaJ protein n=1 Tax=Symbiodinium pilosum TaxID=2952 RepID=A0A812MNN6_SYMPI|nr:dnaJ [Symbiodinium pilosum]